jgi:hypothetical protein
MRLENPLRLQNTYVEFAGDRVPDVAPAGMARLYYDQTTGLIQVSANGGAYGGGIGTRLRDLTEYLLPASPLNSTTAAEMLFGSVGSLSGGASAGTWLGINHAASSADFLNFQASGMAKFRVYNSGAVDIAGTLTLGTGGATVAADSSGQITAASAVGATTPFRAGRGKPLGNPTGTPSLATNGAGVLTGVYQYAYTEIDASGSGETGLSPVASITPAGNTVRVTMPDPRRGVDRRKLYRTAAGGSVFKLVHDFGGATGYFQTLWDDNTADGSLGAAAPAADTTALYELLIAAGVKHLSAHPDQLDAAADWTIVTGKADVGGAYGIDSYAPIFCRTRIGSNFGAQKTGTSGNFIQCDTLGALDDGSSPVTVWSVDGRGNLLVRPLTLVDGGSNAFSTNATFPTTLTTNASANDFTATGAGSSAFSQQAVSITMLAGFTGNSTAYGLLVQQATANSGASAASIGAQAKCTGASPQNCGLSGIAQGGTKNIGVFGGLGAAPDSANVSAAILANNGATTDDIFRCVNNSTTVFRVRNGGYAVFSSLTNGSVLSGDFWLDSTQKCFQYFTGNTVQRIPSALFTATADKTVANTASETSLVGTGVGTANTGTFGGGFFVAGKTLRVRVRGYLSNTGTPTLNLIVKLGSVTICSTGAVATITGQSNAGFELVCDLTCRTTGASGTIIGEGMFSYGTANGTRLVATAAATVDTTAAQLLDVTATWGTASSSNTITAATCTIEALN